MLKDKIKKYLKYTSEKVIAVIGDVMLDQYFWGNVYRVSPEAPVPVVDITSESYHLGGAANVAQNLKSLNCNPILCGLLGNDNRGKRFLEICEKLELNTIGLYKSENRITTVKTRVIGNGQQIVRMDRESTNPIDSKCENFLLNTLKCLPKLDGIIFEDYDKGTISKNLILQVIAFAKEKNIPTFVDPKLNNFPNYSNVTLFKPNKKETEAGLKIKLNNKENIINAGNVLIKNYNIENVLITLGTDGMMLFEKNGNITSVPTIARKVADVSGAGDTAIATLTATYVSGAPLSESAIIANIASGIVCEKPGIVAIEKEELIEAVQKYS
jgi:rfaE bifunctional protein kinase chain/domain